MRSAAALLLAMLPAMAAAQSVVLSPRPDKVAVTVYREPYGGPRMNLNWLNGFAMVSETRRVSLPAGETELRFEGVAGGLVPQSATVSLPDGTVLEKNRDAKLLSPGTLLDAHLGKRVHLRRTSKATGAVREQDAVIRASGEGVVIETEAGFEALRCTGLKETLLPREVPETLAAKPTLSVRVRSDRPVAGNVTLTYLSSGFDWRAHYIATLSPDEKSLDMFAWLTLANGDETGFADAEAMAVAGRLNRAETERLQPEMRPIHLTCWPSQRTHEIPGDERGYVGQLRAPPPPPPPPAPESDAVALEAIVVTGSRMKAEQEDLGDLKLYRIPIPVTVPSNSQKQVALLERPSARVQSFYRFRTGGFDYDTGGPQSAERILKMENRKKDGLGLPLPAGSFSLFTQRGGEPFLLGEGRMIDRAVGEMVEVVIGPAPGIRVDQRPTRVEGDVAETELVVTNDQPHAVRFEAQYLDQRKLLHATEKLERRDGAWWWTVNLPANASRTLRLRYRRIES